MITEEHFIMITGPIPQEDIAILNVYIANNNVCFKIYKYIKQKLLELKDQIENSIIIARDFNSPHSIIDGRSTKNQ